MGVEKLEDCDEATVQIRIVTCDSAEARHQNNRSKVNLIKLFRQETVEE